LTAGNVREKGVKSQWGKDPIIEKDSQPPQLRAKTKGRDYGKGRERKKIEDRVTKKLTLNHERKRVLQDPGNRKVS